MRILLKIAKWIGICLVAALIGVCVLFVYDDYRVRQQTQMIPEEDCPILAKLLPIDHTPIKPDDYIELKTLSAGPYSWNPIFIRIYSDGRIDRETVETVRGDTFGCPLEEADRTLNISPVTATNLIARARDGGFCRLCGSYHHKGFVYDGGWEGITLSVNKKAIAVSNRDGTPPPLFNELSDAIWRLSPMENLANPAKFAPKRAAKCEGFLEEQEAQEQDRLKRKKPNGP